MFLKLISGRSEWYNMVLKWHLRTYYKIVLISIFNRVLFLEMASGCCEAFYRAVFQTIQWIMSGAKHNFRWPFFYISSAFGSAHGSRNYWSRPQQHQIFTSTMWARKTKINIESVGINSRWGWENKVTNNWWLFAGRYHQSIDPMEI